MISGDVANSVIDRQVQPGWKQSSTSMDGLRCACEILVNQCLGQSHYVDCPYQSLC